LSESLAYSKRMIRIDRSGRRGETNLV